MLIIDDYNYLQGAKKATDDYFRENGIRMFLHDIDRQGVIGVKAGCQVNK